ncbi:hypothetical protein B0J11DRAFT_508199 [Dendryphion nanum]|uniref:4'-phosphopantetheinyl transferase domain-containing protein n=1 Tax=Dendryphion nanum TaxID=256645 RepID=A0A9P9IIX7_9PLEO|nr:hypothetical protein B0J11DRAFT_508199 [Dendryphion nanum]
MPLRPFPYSLRVGTDICSISRVRELLTGKNRKTNSDPTALLAQFLTKVFTWPERQAFEDRFDSYAKACKHPDQVSAFLAGRWAAKEACRKACTHLSTSNGFHNIMILPSNPKRSPKFGTQAPTGIVLRQALQAYLVRKEETRTHDQLVRRVGFSSAEFDMEKVEGQSFQVSISHDGEYATAVAVVPPMPQEWSLDVGSLGMDPSASEKTVPLNDCEVAQFDTILEGNTISSIRSPSEDNKDLDLDTATTTGRSDSLNELLQEISQLKNRIKLRLRQALKHLILSQKSSAPRQMVPGELVPSVTHYLKLDIHECGYELKTSGAWLGPGAAQDMAPKGAPEIFPMHYVIGPKNSPSQSKSTGPDSDSRHVYGPSTSLDLQLGDFLMRPGFSASHHYTERRKAYLGNFIR